MTGKLCLKKSVQQCQQPVGKKVDQRPDRKQVDLCYQHSQYNSKKDIGTVLVKGIIQRGKFFKITQQEMRAVKRWERNKIKNKQSPVYKDAIPDDFFKVSELRCRSKPVIIGKSLYIVQTE